MVNKDRKKRYIGLYRQVSNVILAAATKFRGAVFK